MTLAVTFRSESEQFSGTSIRLNVNRRQRQIRTPFAFFFGVQLVAILKHRHQFFCPLDTPENLKLVWIKVNHLLIFFFDPTLEAQMHKPVILLKMWVEPVLRNVPIVKGAFYM